MVKTLLASHAGAQRNASLLFAFHYVSVSIVNWIHNDYRLLLSNN